MKKLLLAFVVMSVDISCSNKIDVMKHRDSSMLIDEDKLDDFKNRALSGDGDKAWDLYLHYSLGVRDEDEAIRWLDRSASLGNSKALKMKEIKRSRSKKMTPE